MSAQFYSVPGQTEGRGKAFLEWESINLSNKSLTCEGNFNFYESVHHPVPTRVNRRHPDNFQNKSVSSPFNWISMYILLFAKLKGRGWPFLKGGRRGGEGTLRDFPQEHLLVIRDEKVSPFVKFKIILFLLYFLLESLRNKHCRTWNSMINLWIDSRTYKKQRILLSAKQRFSNYLEPSKKDVLGEYDAVTLTML